MERTKVKFERGTKCCIPCVRVSLMNGNTTLAIIDSGSDTSLVAKDFVTNNPDCISVTNTDCVMNCSGVYSSGSNELTIAKADLKFGNDCCTSATLSILDMTELKASFLKIYSIIPDILLGSDFLDENNVKIDYENSCIEL